jgi:hypothetical protein
MQGAWNAAGQRLDVYSSHGERLRSYEMPAERLLAIRSDGRGRMFLVSAHAVDVMKDPTVSTELCGRLPSLVHVDESETPPFTKALAAR